MSTSTTVKVIWAAVTCIAAGPALAGRAEIPKGVPRDRVLFYVSYDQGATADVARGAAEAAGNTMPVPGQSGNARAFVGPVTYSAESNISKHAGAVALWFCPKWAPADGKHHALFDWRGRSYGHDRILLYKYAGANRIYFGLRSRKGTRASRKVTCLAQTTGWKRGQWHHLVGTWDDSTSEVVLYVDGRPVTRANMKWEFGAMPKKFAVGSPGTSIDELLILNRPLSDKRAYALYKSYFPDAAPNPQFERAAPRGPQPEGWAGGTLTKPGRKGGFCLRLEIRRETLSSSAAELKVKPGRAYSVQYWAKVTSGGSLSARLALPAGKDNAMQEAVRHALDGPIHWTQCAFTFQVPPHARGARLRFRLAAAKGARASACIDDLEILPAR